MKRIAIVYSQSLKDVQGINYVNNSFVEGQKYFNKNGFKLLTIFSPSETFECENKAKLDLIGSNLGTASYRRERKIRTFLRELFSSNFILGASIKFYFNNIRNAKKTVKKLLERYNEYDYLIFQDLTTAGYYLKNTKNIDRKKSILILHCSKEPYEQTRPEFPALFKNKIWTKWIDDNMEFVFENIGKVVYLSQRAVNNSILDNQKKTYVFNGEEDLTIHEFSEIHKPINLVCVGSIAWRKGQDYVIEALAKLPKGLLQSYKLHLIGSGAQIDELRNLVRKFDIEKNVIFYGERNDVPELLKKMDVFIMPSKSEGLPMSIIEALRQGMYLIATDTGAIPEMIASGCGEIVERDAAKIADCLTDIIKGNKLSKEMKIQARNHYLNHFTLKAMIDGYCNVLNSL